MFELQKKEYSFSNIDWFKFEIVLPLNVDSKKKVFYKLFDILKLDFDLYDEVPMGNMFSENRKYEGNTVLSLHPIESAVRRDGRDYVILDMSAKACRDFELRGGKWFELITFLNSLTKYQVVDNKTIYSEQDIKDLPFDVGEQYEQILFQMKRIDLAIDVADNPFFTLDQLKKKIRSCSYVSKFRSLKNNKLVDNPSLQHKAHQEIFTSGQVDDFQFIDSKYGYSVIFGNKDNLQLNIYDKKSEVFVKSGGSDILPYNELVRYEMRFANNHAQTVIYELSDINNFSDIDKYCVNKLYSIIKFKKNIYGNTRDFHNISRSDDWPPFVNMLLSVGNLYKTKYKLVCPKQVPATDPFMKTKNWINTSVYNSLTDMLVVDNDYSNIFDVLKNSLLHSFQKGYFNFERLAKINKERKKVNKEEFDILDLMRNAKEYYINLGGDKKEFKMSYNMYEEVYSKFLNWTDEFFEKEDCEQEGGY